jgi:hypothetical protein
VDYSKNFTFSIFDFPKPITINSSDFKGFYNKCPFKNNELSEFGITKNDKNYYYCFNLNDTFPTKILKIPRTQFNSQLSRCSNSNFKSLKCQGNFTNYTNLSYELAISSTFPDFDNNGIKREVFKFTGENFTFDNYPYDLNIVFTPLKIYFDTGFLSEQYPAEPIYYNEMNNYKITYDSTRKQLLNTYNYNYGTIKIIHVTNDKIFNVIGKCMSLILLIKFILFFIYFLFDSFYYQKYLFNILRQKIPYQNFLKEKENPEKFVENEIFTLSNFIKLKVCWFIASDRNVFILKAVLNEINKLMNIKNFIGIKEDDASII